jgi:esterase/lipase
MYRCFPPNLITIAPELPKCHVGFTIANETDDWWEMVCKIYDDMKKAYKRKTKKTRQV